MPKTTIRIVLVFICLLCAAFLAGCSQKEPIKIGLVGTLSGLRSEMSVTGRNGAVMAIEEINKAGGLNGRPLRLVVKDDGGSPETAQKADQELINDGVVAIIGHFTSNMQTAAMPYINKAGILAISPTVATSTLSGLDDNLIKLMPCNKYQAILLTDLSTRKLKLKKMALVYDAGNTAYTMELCEIFTKTFEKQGGRVIYTGTLVSGKYDTFSAIAKKLMKSGADGILIVAGSQDTAMLCQQLKKYGSQAYLMTSLWAMTNDLIKEGGKSVEGIFLPGIYDENCTKPQCAKFEDIYNKRYTSPPTFSSAFAYESVFLLFDALKNNTDYSSTALKKYILASSSYKGLEGDIKFDRFGDSLRNHFLSTVKDDEFQKVE
jgi:branched-chain amino acid transport system substrate-binding protein